jgi:penicillin-binding protein 2
MLNEQELIAIHRKRAYLTAQFIIICFLVILCRLWYLQVYKGDTFHTYSLKNRLREELVRAPRGMIYDRNDELLVDNAPRFDAAITRQYLKNKKQTLEKLSKVLNINVSRIQKLIKRKSFEAKYRPITIKKNITREEVAIIEVNAQDLPGVSVETLISRKYRDKDSGAHLLGYISEITRSQLPKLSKRDDMAYHLGDFIGQFGLEERMDNQLRGDNGLEYVEVDAGGRKRKYINTDNLFAGIENQPSRPGNNLKLTIDRDMQNAGRAALEGKAGSVVAIDIKTGEVLAMVSTPSFLPSEFSKGLTSKYWKSLVNNTKNPLRDRSIQEHYSPGSTFKPFTAIAALEEGVINPDTKIRCHGTLQLGNRTYHSWKRYGKEKVDVVGAIRQSCNIFFWSVTKNMDIDVLAKYARLFGLGSKSEINLPREVSGLIPSNEWKQKKYGKPWQQGETLSCAIGQSFILTSPLQLAVAYAAIANEGKVLKPYVVKEIFSNAGKVIKTFSPQVLSEFKLKPSTWKSVKRGLYEVANNPKGTAWYRKGFGNNMAGKTGTTQVVNSSKDTLYAKCEDKDYEKRHHGLFVAFAPYDDPKIAVASIVEHGCHGSSAAAPIVEKVINTYMKKYDKETYDKYVPIEKKAYYGFLKNANATRKLKADKKEALRKKAEAQENE